MSALVELTQFGARTNSRVVADAFEKEHKDVLRAIDGIVEAKPELIGRNFAPNVIKVKTGFGGGREVRAFEMDRDGFTLVAMGFTGAKALDWKLAFIDAFNRMEEELRTDRTQVARFEPSVMRDYSPALAVMREARQIYSPKECRALWPQLGLPDPSEYDPARVEVDRINATMVDDTMIDWRNACTVDEDGVSTPASDLWESYRAWCALEGRTCANRTRFGRAIASMGYGIERSGGGYVHRVGIKLVS